MDRMAMMMEDDLWMSGRMECLACAAVWIGVWPLGCDDLECPNCRGTDTCSHNQEE